MPPGPPLRERVIAALLAATLAGAPSVASACTRLVYHGAGDQVITAQTMDWEADIATNLWIFPRGMVRTGEVGPNSLTWTSKYGSVIASAYDIATTDGINEAGLVANVLWLVESEYPKFDGSKPGLTIAASRFPSASPRRTSRTSPRPAGAPSPTSSEGCTSSNPC
jgi:choloylglycine hydrolase